MKLSITILITSCIVAFVCFISCTKESSNPVTRQFEITGFNKLIASDDHEIIITKGASFSVQAKGSSADVEDLRMIVNGETLKIDYPYYNGNRKRVDILITMPSLSVAEFGGAAYGTISGFQQQVNFTLYLSGNSKFDVSCTSALIDANVSGTSKLTLRGSAASLVANISGQGVLEGSGMSGTYNSIIKTSGQANATFNAGKVLTADASGQSRIFYKGHPEAKNITEREMAKVISQ